MISTGNKMLSNIHGIPVISVIYGLSLQLLYGKLEKSLKCQKVWYDFLILQQLKIVWQAYI